MHQPTSHDMITVSVAAGDGQDRNCILLFLADVSILSLTSLDNNINGNNIINSFYGGGGDVVGGQKRLAFSRSTPPVHWALKWVI